MENKQKLGRPLEVEGRPLNKMSSIRLSAIDTARLNALAAARGISKSALIREWINANECRSVTNG